MRIPGLVVAALLVALSADAIAEDVDWSQYVDHSPSKVEAPAKPVPVAKTRAKRVARSAKVVTTKAKAKPRAKTKRRR